MPGEATPTPGMLETPGELPTFTETPIPTETLLPTETPTLEPTPTETLIPPIELPTEALNAPALLYTLNTYKQRRVRQDTGAPQKRGEIGRAHV